MSETPPDIPTTGTVSIMQSWDHATVLAKGAGVFSGKMNTGNIDAVLQDYGKNGWELVSVFQGSNVSANLPGVLLFFKRPRLTGA